MISVGCKRISLMIGMIHPMNENTIANSNRQIAVKRFILKKWTLKPMKPENSAFNIPQTPNSDVVDTTKTAPPSNNPSHTNIFMRLKESLPNALRMPIVFVLSVKLWLIKLTSSKAENAAKTILKTEAIFVNITTFASRPYRLVTAGSEARITASLSR